MEIKDVVGFEKLYTVSEYGDIMSLPRTAKHSDRNTIRKVPAKKISKWSNHRGYELVSLHKDSKKIGIPVHIIVAKAFIPNPENKPEVNHKDGNKKNNYVSNLEWVTRKENNDHSLYILGNHMAGEAHYKAKLTVETVLKMRETFTNGLYSMAAVGRMFGVNNKDHAANIIKNKIWKTLKKA